LACVVVSRRAPPEGHPAEQGGGIRARVGDLQRTVNRLAALLAGPNGEKLPGLLMARAALAADRAARELGELMTLLESTTHERRIP
jgi:hypothetical protein